MFYNLNLLSGSLPLHCSSGVSFMFAFIFINSERYWLTVHRRCVQQHEDEFLFVLDYLDSCLPQSACDFINSDQI